jgi:YHS domain-containing protein
MMRIGTIGRVVATGAVLFMGAPLFAQAGKPAPKPAAKPAAAAPQATTEVVHPVIFWNETCPVDGKAVAAAKFVDVDGQRVCVCSDACIDAVKKDTKGMVAKAYPTAKPVVSKVCACGKPLVAGKTTDVTWQGHTISTCSAECAATIKKSPAAAVALLTNPGSTDMKNAVDPVDGKPVDAQVMAVYKKKIVHFATPASVAAFEKDPETILAKVKANG